MRDRTITLSSAAKTFSLTGWKIGWALAPPDLSDAIRRVHQFVDVRHGHAVPGGHRHRAGDGGNHRLLRRLPGRIHRPPRLPASALAGAGLRPLTPEGSFFILADIAPLGLPRRHHLRPLPDRRGGVACIPPSVFYSGPLPDQLARFCFAKRPETLQAAAERLAAWAAGYAKANNKKRNGFRSRPEKS